MKKLATALAATAILAVSGPSAAQDMGAYAGVLTSVADGFGGGLGSAMVGGDSVFVYAEGRAPLSGSAPTSSKDVYTVPVSFDAPNAALAVAERDAALDRLGKAAKRFEVVMSVTAASVSYGDTCQFGDPTVYNPRCVAVAMAARTKNPAQPAEPPKPVFTARAMVKFTAPSAAQTGAFLDALHDAGADNIGPVDDSANILMRVRTTATAAEMAKVAQATWDDAARDAIRAARSQAMVLAQADGRDVGEARQILFLARNVDGGSASVTVAVRFQLSPKH